MIKAFSMRRISPGIMSDEGIVTITAAATIVPDRWTTVSVALNCPLLERGVPKFGSLYWPLRIFIDGKPQQLTTANLLPELEGYKEAMSVKLTPWYSEKARFTFGCYKDRFFKGMIANVRIWRGGFAELFEHSALLGPAVCCQSWAAHFERMRLPKS